MQRREFLGHMAGTAVLTMAGTAGVLVAPLEGCSFNITGAVNTVLTSALAILKVAEPGATWTSALGSAIAALEQAEAQWQAGGTSAFVIDALNTIEAVLAAIPATAVYSPLIDILVAGIEAVMAGFGLATQLTATALNKRAAVVKSPHYKAAALHGPNLLHPTWQGAYKHQWNSEAEALKLSGAKI